MGRLHLPAACQGFACQPTRSQISMSSEFRRSSTFLPLSARCFLIGKGGQEGQVRQFSGCCEADFGPHWTANQLHENRKLPNLSFLPSLADWELINYFSLILWSRIQFCNTSTHCRLHESYNYEAIFIRDSLSLFACQTDRANISQDRKLDGSLGYGAAWMALGGAPGEE